MWRKNNRENKSCSLPTGRAPVEYQVDRIQDAILARVTQFFSFLPAQIGAGPWNHIEITILYVQDQWGGGPVLSLTHTL